jgi:hypothetical protein
MLLVGAWCSLAIWYRCGFDEPLRTIFSGAAAACTVCAVGCLAARVRWGVFLAYSAAVAGILVWWAAISPATDRNWPVNAARSMTARIDGDRVLINNVRNFNWRSETDFDPVWEQRSYRLSQAANVVPAFAGVD